MSRIKHLKHSGVYVDHSVYSCVSCDSHKKQRSSVYIPLTDLWWRCHVFSLEQKLISLNIMYINLIFRISKADFINSSPYSTLLSLQSMYLSKIHFRCQFIHPWNQSIYCISFSTIPIIIKQEVLWRTNRPLSFDTTLIAQKTMRPTILLILLLYSLLR
jgi:hypothetical protein